MKEKSNIDKWVESGFDANLLQQLKDQHPNDQDLHNAELIVNSVQGLRPIYEKSKKDLWNELESKLTDDVVPLKPKSISYRWYAAASVLLVIGVLFIWKLFYSDTASLTSIETGPAQSKNIQLPDQSAIVVNAQSTIQYNADNWSEQRKINLKGEAFFTVVKGSTFEVETDLGSIRVLGTSFNVKARGKLLSVSCKTGKVRVAGPTGKPLVLTSGMSVRFDRGNRTLRSNQDTSQMGSWINGDLYFTNVPLNEVLDELENQYEVIVKVENPSIFDKQYTGFIHVNRDIDQAMEDICLPLNLRYDFNEESREITLRY